MLNYKNLVPELVCNQRDLDFLTHDVANHHGLAVFSHKVAKEKVAGSDPYPTSKQLLRLSSGYKFYEFCEKLMNTFYPLSLFVGFTSPDFPKFKMHHHYRASLEDYYQFRNVVTLGRTSGLETLIINGNETDLADNFSFSFHQKSIHGVRVTAKLGIFYIMDDVDPIKVQELLPDILYLI